MIERNGKQYPKPTLQQSLEGWCLLNDLIKLGYPHDFQKELPHIRSYMWKVTDLVKDAIHIRDGREKKNVGWQTELQPTIDVVPISFIEKKIESIQQYLSKHEGEEFMSGLISKAIAYEKLIEEWREENGQTDYGEKQGR